LELGNIGEVEWKVGDEKSNMEVRKTLIILYMRSVLVIYMHSSVIYQLPVSWGRGPQYFLHP
jgi:hypothetical protein